MLSIKHLDTSYNGIPILQDLNLEVYRGEIVVIVGESGSGKSTLLKSIMQIQPELHIDRGSIYFENMDITHGAGASFSARSGPKKPRTSADKPSAAHADTSTAISAGASANTSVGSPPASSADTSAVRSADPSTCPSLYGSRLTMIFQDPGRSLDPLRKISHLFVETVQIHDPSKSKKEILVRARRLLTDLNIEDPDRVLASYPFELSGGICQRVCIAAAMMNQPSLLLADEPTSDLDVHAQRQVIDLLLQMRRTYHLSVLAVTHSMGVAAKLADRIAVMYAGRLVELGPAAEVLSHPLHPYTRGLLAATPDMHKKELHGIAGQPPRFQAQIASGCPFFPRCTQAADRCKQENIPLRQEGLHLVRCCLDVFDASTFASY